MEIDDWTFTMITPDGIVGGYVDLVVERLAAFGLEITGCRLLRLDWEALGRVYTNGGAISIAPPIPGQRSRGLPESVMRQIHALAPACVLLLRHPDAATRTMLRCKGATEPTEAATGTIRRHGENTIFNLVHCPDDPASAARELTYLLGERDAAGLRAIASDPVSARLVALPVLAACLPAFSGPEALSFPLVANRLHWRALNVLAPRIADSPAAIARLYAVQAILRAEREALGGAQLADERLTMAQASYPPIGEGLLKVAKGDVVLERGLLALGALYDIDGERDLAAIVAMADAGIYTSALERVALDAHLHVHWQEGPAGDQRRAAGSTARTGTSPGQRGQQRKGQK